jgi:hypothetical protein
MPIKEVKKGQEVLVQVVKDLSVPKPEALYAHRVAAVTL